LLIRSAPISTLFPYTTLFRSYSTITNTAEYIFNIDNQHNFVVLAGQEYVKSTTTGLSGSSTGHTDDRLTLIGSGPNNRNAGSSRSEEHTSELQSRENLVCRLL